MSRPKRYAMTREWSAPTKLRVAYALRSTLPQKATSRAGGKEITKAAVFENPLADE